MSTRAHKPDGCVLHRDCKHLQACSLGSCNSTVYGKPLQQLRAEPEFAVLVQLAACTSCLHVIYGLAHSDLSATTPHSVVPGGDTQAVNCYSSDKQLRARTLCSCEVVRKAKAMLLC